MLSKPKIIQLSKINDNIFSASDENSNTALSTNEVSLLRIIKKSE